MTSTDCQGVRSCFLCARTLIVFGRIFRCFSRVRCRKNTKKVQCECCVVGLSGLRRRGRDFGAEIPEKPDRCGGVVSVPETQESRMPPRRRRFGAIIPAAETSFRSHNSSGEDDELDDMEPKFKRSRTGEC
ncbi:uncharacterized protein LOC135943900 [Cloeon dipterum]|uniref:uncharacterized protein LOC135943900 n=1 Tax=Cloeon dipterum TaxID=197152 RepID=UPI00321F717D